MNLVETNISVKTIRAFVEIRKVIGSNSLLFYKIYHIGASLKDLGKKWFAFSNLTHSSSPLLSKSQNFNPCKKIAHER